MDDGSDFETNAGQAEVADDEDEDMDDVVEEEKDDDEVGRTAEQRWRASDLSKRAAARAVSSCVSRAATL